MQIPSLTFSAPWLCSGSQALLLDACEMKESSWVVIRFVESWRKAGSKREPISLTPSDELALSEPCRIHRSGCCPQSDSISLSLTDQGQHLHRYRMVTAGIRYPTLQPLLGLSKSCLAGPRPQRLPTVLQIILNYLFSFFLKASLNLPSPLLQLHISGRNYLLRQ